jgi:ATP-dependent RNA helicase DDX20
VIVGTPGRILQLINDGYLLPASLTMFVLDEADKMLQEGAMKSATLEVMKQLPSPIQFLCVSATYSDAMLQELDHRIPNPIKLLLPSGNPTLQGVKQYYLSMPEGDAYRSLTQQFQWKHEQLLRILNSLSFHQCIIFCNAITRSNTLVEKLRANGWPTKVMSAQLTQQERISAMNEFRDFRVRILLSSDLVARGLDIERINLVINLDLPTDAETYLHRVGRTGRFGTLGVAINILDASDMTKLHSFIKTYDSSIEPLPEVIPPDLYHYELDEKDQKKKERLEEVSTQLKQDANRPKDKSTTSKGSPKKRKRQESIQQEADDEVDFSHKLACPDLDCQPPPHPNAFWHPSYFLQYITETYLPHLHSQIESASEF